MTVPLSGALRFGHGLTLALRFGRADVIFQVLGPAVLLGGLARG